MKKIRQTIINNLSERYSLLMDTDIIETAAEAYGLVKKISA